ncbi:complement C4-B-like [Polyodon spathula]|uniref:complement C4-B-like n=1 Tax=Polyodon spathula TaxID=7913 RepID=UPI001B7F5B3E|nr:complement C4-B-like [Polyodon spathula]
MSFLLLLLCISALIPVAEQKPLCLITAPNIVHVGVDETVSVQVHGATNPVNVDLFFEDQINRRKVSSEVHLSLNEGNKYQGIVKLKVDPELIKNLEKAKRHRSPYVSLVAQSTDLFEKKYEKGEFILGSMKKANILLSTRKGYIFIQTDKPIYTPNEIVKFRIFTLDDYMRPTEETIKISIFNSKGLLVYNIWKNTNQIIQQYLTIPDVAQ